MKIVTYKLKCNLTRKGDDVEVHVDTNNREFVREEVISNADIKELPTLSAKIGEENSLQKGIAKQTLFPDQREAEISIELKFLE